MTLRSPEALWPLVLPTTIAMGFALHVPLLLSTWGVIPNISEMNITAVSLLLGSTALGVLAAANIYLSDSVAKPIKLQPQALQDFFAYDLYTAQFYKVTIVSLVDLISQTISWFDKFIVDGLVNLVGIFTVFSGQSLKYNVSGQTQFYVLSILLGIALLGIVVCWPLLAQISLVFS